jgi:hypothetical protein
MACGPCRYRKDRTWPKRCRAEWGACAQRCPRASGTQRGKTSCAVQMVEPIFPRTRTQVLSFCEQHVAANRCRNVLPQPLRIPRGSCVGFPGCRVFTNAEPILKATYFRFASGLAFSNMGLVPKPLQRCEGGRVVFSERLEPTAIADCQASAAGAADQTSRP